MLKSTEVDPDIPDFLLLNPNASQNNKICSSTENRQNVYWFAKKLYTGKSIQKLQIRK